jgi:hypothetical protein
LLVLEFGWALNGFDANTAIDVLTTERTWQYRWQAVVRNLVIEISMLLATAYFIGSTSGAIRGVFPWYNGFGWKT